MKMTGLAYATTLKAMNELIQEGMILNRSGCQGNVVANPRCRVLGITGGFEETRFWSPCQCLHSGEGFRHRSGSM